MKISGFCSSSWGRRKLFSVGSLLFLLILTSVLWDEAAGSFRRRNRNGNSERRRFSSFLSASPFSKSFPSRVSRYMFWRNAEYEHSHNRYTTSELIERAGFPSETHNIITEDGYILPIHRIPAKLPQPKSLDLDLDLEGTGNSSTTPSSEYLPPTAPLPPVVIFFSGLFACGDSWVLVPEKSLPFVLSNLNYDVWLANPRGCSYSRRHQSRQANNTEFWDFSWHEMGVFDAPATIDYVLKKTGQTKVNLIGHSMGTTMNFVMLSEKPEYNDKVNMSINLAPVAHMNHVGSPLVRGLAMLIRFLPLYLSVFSTLGTWGTQEIFPRTDFVDNLVKQFCADGEQKRRCVAGIFAGVGFDFCQSNPDYLPWILSYFPSGSSIWTTIHYLQMVNTKEFRQFDYGLFPNLLRYRQMEPPRYRLENIKAPQYFFYADNDWLSHPTDVHKLASEIPQSAIKEVCRVRHKTFNHFDYTTAKDVHKLVYDRVLRVLRGESCRLEGEDDQVDDDSIKCPPRDKLADNLSHSYNSILSLTNPF